MTRVAWTNHRSVAKRPAEHRGIGSARRPDCCRKQETLVTGAWIETGQPRPAGQPRARPSLMTRQLSSAPLDVWRCKVGQRRFNRVLSEQQSPASTAVRGLSTLACPKASPSPLARAARAALRPISPGPCPAASRSQSEVGRRPRSRARSSAHDLLALDELTTGGAVAASPRKPGDQRPGHFAPATHRGDAKPQALRVKVSSAWAGLACAYQRSSVTLDSAPTCELIDKQR